MIVIKQRPVIDTQNIKKRKQHIILWKNQITKVDSQRGRKEEKNYKAARKQLTRWQ